MYIKNVNNSNDKVPVNIKDFDTLMGLVENLTSFIKIHQTRIVELEKQLNDMKGN